MPLDTDERHPSPQTYRLKGGGGWAFLPDSMKKGCAENKRSSLSPWHELANLLAIDAEAN